jgi:hypothetical protein
VLAESPKVFANYFNWKSINCRICSYFFFFFLLKAGNRVKHEAMKIIPTYFESYFTVNDPRLFKLTKRQHSQNTVVLTLVGHLLPSGILNNLAHVQY